MAVNNQNIAESKARTQLSVTENLMRQRELSFLPQAQKLQLAQGAADIAFRYSQKNLTDKQARHEIEKLSETVVRANGQALQNQFDADTYKNRVKQVQEVLWNTMHEAGHLTGLTNIIGRLIRPAYE